MLDMRTFILWAFLSLSFSSLSLAGEVLSLAQFLEKVKGNHLGLKVESAKAGASEAQSIGVNLPPPMVGVVQMSEKGGSQVQGYEVSQTIPFPSKLIADHSSRKEEAEAQKEMFHVVKQEVLTEAKRNYISLWVMQEKLKYLELKKQNLEEHVKLSRSSARSDSSAHLHLLKSESILDTLSNEIESSEQSLRELQAKMAELIHENPATYQFVAEEPKLSEEPQRLGSSHQLEAKKLTLESLKSKETEQDSQWLPDFNLRYKQLPALGATPANQEVMIGVTLPFVFFWEPYAASKQAGFKRAQAEVELEKESLNIETQKTIAAQKMKSLLKQMKNLKENILPRAEKRMKLIHNISPRDMESLQDHFEIVQEYPELKLKELGLREEYEAAVSELEKYQGL